MSEKAFALRVSFVAGVAARPRLVSVAVSWEGDPFVVERLVSKADLKRGYADVRFGKDQTLPTGPARFDVDLFGEAGAQSSFTVTCAVLPSNPFSLSLSPRIHHLTGTNGARAVRAGNSFFTPVTVTVSNGNGAGETLPGTYRWKFWDGGVGETLIEEGSSSIGLSFIPAHSTGVAGSTSPHRPAAGCSTSSPIAGT